MDLDSKLLSLITQLLSMNEHRNLMSPWDPDGKFIVHAIPILRFVGTMDFDTLRKPESELMSLTCQAISLLKSMDLDSQPEQLSKVISICTKLMGPTYSDLDSESIRNLSRKMYVRFGSLFYKTSRLEPEPRIISLLHQIFSLVISANSKWTKLISICPLVKVSLGEDKIHVDEEEEDDDVRSSKYNKWQCLPLNWIIMSLISEDEDNNTHFFCQGCNGNNHQGYEKTPPEINHPLHPKRSLQLAVLRKNGRERKCYCCDDYLKKLIYWCLACGFAMNIACLEKPRVFTIHRPKWHEHPLSLFSRTTSLTCDVCALADSPCPFYICPPCGFVVHRRCLDLPRVIRISRHPHRISFTASYTKGSFSCGVCRNNINNNYGGYFCIENGCSYAAHSRCATQINVWDGIELEGVPEEIEEHLEPFVRLSDGTIRHFSHQHHRMRLDENSDKDYDENKQCQACTTPVYFGNFYSCLQCDFILHEECMNLSRKIYHPIHPHMLTLVGESDKNIEFHQGSCSACAWICTTGFFYKCERCDFKVHVQCAIISEPLVHGSHTNPLFLTSKPGEKRKCSVCKLTPSLGTTETFNCIVSDFSLCFGCATIPQKVRYKYDKHLFSLCYGKETNAMASWCECCEKNIDPEARFYMCDENCCTTLHVGCLIGNDLYMKLGSSWYQEGKKVEVMPNNLHMSRPFCVACGRRCTKKLVLKMSGLIFCSTLCTHLSK